MAGASRKFAHRVARFLPSRMPEGKSRAELMSAISQ